MKKLFLIITSMMLLSANVFAGEKEDVLATFDKFVQAANSYSREIPNYYVSNAKIIRVVNKKQGGQKGIIIPFDRYLKELNANSILAKAVKYKNRYENRKISKVDGGYKVTAIRIPRNDETGLPCYFIFTKQGATWKIKEESMETNVQMFLNAK